MGDVVKFTGLTLQDMDADIVLEAGKDANLKTAVVVGLLENGELYLAGTTSDIGQVVILLRLAEREFLDMVTP